MHVRACLRMWAMALPPRQAINASPGEYDTDYGFFCCFHALERPNKVIIRTFHK